MNSSFGDNVGVETVAEFDRVEVITTRGGVSIHQQSVFAFSIRAKHPASATDKESPSTYHSKSLYIIVKKT